MKYFTIKVGMTGKTVCVYSVKTIEHHTQIAYNCRSGRGESMTSRQKILADREQYVVKANDLIRRTRYNLTAQQQKIVLYCISKIKPEDEINTQYEININDLAHACGLQIDQSGTYYGALKRDLDKLTTRQWCTMPDGVQMTISWIGDAIIIPLNSTVYIRFNPNMQPYLFDLKEKYTQYQLYNVLVFKGKYSIRLYELLRSYTTQRNLDDDKEAEINLTLDEVRLLLDIKGYDSWREFNRRVIAPAVNEINRCADDIHVDFYPMKGERSRRIEKINFVITKASPAQQVQASKARKSRLDHINPYGVNDA